MPREAPVQLLGLCLARPEVLSCPRAFAHAALLPGCVSAVAAFLPVASASPSPLQRRPRGCRIWPEPSDILCPHPVCLSICFLGFAWVPFQSERGREGETEKRRMCVRKQRSDSHPDPRTETERKAGTESRREREPEKGPWWGWGGIRGPPCPSGVMDVFWDLILGTGAQVCTEGRGIGRCQRVPFMKCELYRV